MANSLQEYIEAISDTKARAILNALSTRLESLESEVDDLKERVSELEAGEE